MKSGLTNIMNVSKDIKKNLLYDVRLRFLADITRLGGSEGTLSTAKWKRQRTESRNVGMYCGVY